MLWNQKIKSLQWTPFQPPQGMPGLHHAMHGRIRFISRPKSRPVPTVPSRLPTTGLVLEHRRILGSGRGRPTTCRVDDRGGRWRTGGPSRGRTVWRTVVCEVAAPGGGEGKRMERRINSEASSLVNSIHHSASTSTSALKWVDQIDCWISIEHPFEGPGTGVYQPWTCQVSCEKAHWPRKP